MKKIYTLIAAAILASAPAAMAQYTMGNYTINPASGSTVSSIETITVTFNGLEDGIDQHILPSNVGEYITITDGTEVYKAISYSAGTTQIDDLVITFPKITKAGTYTLNIAEGVVKDYDQAETAEAGEGYSVNGAITATYTIAQTYMNVWTLDPANGSTVNSLRVINLTFPRTETRDGIDEYSDPMSHITLTCGNTVYTPVSCELTSDYIGAIITFEAISTPGVYTLKIDADVYKEFDTYENESANPEITAVYTIASQVGVEEAPATDAAQTVYDLQGRHYGSLEGLDAGIYICNGKKILIRK